MNDCNIFITSINIYDFFIFFAKQICRFNFLKYTLEKDYFFYFNKILVININIYCNSKK